MSSRAFHVTLTVIEGENEGLSLRLEKPRTVLGRGDCDLTLADKQVSQEHAAIELTDREVILEDLQSRNGVFLNGRPISRAPLLNLDEIQLGSTKIRVIVIDDLQSFRKNNQSGTEIEIQKTDARRDIASLIDDELRRFSKWDLSVPGRSLSHPESPAGLDCVLHVVRGPDLGKKVRLTNRVTSLGRGQAEISFRDADVSRLHAEIEVLAKGQALVRDLGSTNGTYVNGKRVAEGKVGAQDQIQLGSTVLIFSLED